MKSLLGIAGFMIVMATVVEAQSGGGTGGTSRGGSSSSGYASGGTFAGTGYRSGGWWGPYGRGPTMGPGGCGFGYSGYGFGYPGYGFGYAGYGAGYPGFGSYSFMGLGDDGFDLGTMIPGFPGYSFGLYPYANGPYFSRGRGYGAPVGSYPAPSGSSGGAERMKALVSSHDLETGIRRLKSGDYPGAVDAFRAAVVDQPESARAKAHFAVGLAILGDGKNADKALRAAAEEGSIGKIDVNSMMKDEKERLRIMSLLSKVSGDGLLAAAWVQSLGGDPGRLKELAAKDPVAKKLLEP